MLLVLNPVKADRCFPASLKSGSSLEIGLIFTAGGLTTRYDQFANCRSSIGKMTILEAGVLGIS